MKLPVAEQLAKLALVLCALAFTFAVLEAGSRIDKREARFTNFPVEFTHLSRSAYPIKFDPKLGWVPRPGKHPDNVWSTKVTILNNGIRSNANPEGSMLDNDAILAIGDSFTFGDEVSDDESWPAILERITQRRVLNGGVFGYGVDQAYLRLKQLVPLYNPSVVIFSFIPKGIERCEVSTDYAVPKPFFTLDKSGTLQLVDSHILPPPPPAPVPLIKRVLGYSFFIHRIMKRTFPKYWLHGSGESTPTHQNGEDLTCAIFKELKFFSNETGTKIYVLIQYGEDGQEKDPPISNKVIRCLHDLGLPLIDLRDALAHVKRTDRRRYDSFYSAHLTKQGNQFVASILKDAITKPSPAPSEEQQPK